jgi:hypothetical protein
MLLSAKRMIDRLLKTLLKPLLKEDHVLYFPREICKGKPSGRQEDRQTDSWGANYLQKSGAICVAINDCTFPFVGSCPCVSFNETAVTNASSRSIVNSSIFANPL